ncbi:hypothetical protein ACIPQA_32020 [Streptomyces sp. NPDC090109]|nr:hypothetical protein [Streptomyces sp. SID5770]MZE50832.1 hypothetical protein [Streptomyces sp. SID5770]
MALSARLRQILLAPQTRQSVSESRLIRSFGSASRTALADGTARRSWWA